ncbi:MAG: polyphenol oxidase family protein [Deltaproteobacteria bacterium]|jgi:copper oxidase (laccase) domain-containing protein|nr:polyphenol oxidase family protein [Deltaproteobacteria bacterium]
MIRRVQGQIGFYAFESLSRFPELRHGVTTRSGPDGRDWSFSFQNQPDPREVIANIDAACGALGLGPASFVGQVHGARVLVLGPHETYRPREPGQVFEGFDALVSGFGHTLMIRLADCQGLLIYDRASRVLGLAHNGWRGSVQNVAGRTANTMARIFGLDPRGFVACVSPSLGPCCAEFVNYRDELPPEFLDFKDERDHFDFPAITRRQLMAAGLRGENIELSGLCSRCSDDFFSHRRGDAGRFALLAGVVA